MTVDENIDNFPESWRQCGSLPSFASDIGAARSSFAGLNAASTNAENELAAAEATERRATEELAMARADVRTATAAVDRHEAEAEQLTAERSAENLTDAERTQVEADAAEAESDSTESMETLRTAREREASAERILAGAREARISASTAVNRARSAMFGAQAMGQGGTADATVARARFEWYACRFRQRGAQNLNQSLDWENSNFWRDIPLLEAATAVAGLVLFGNRDDDNNLDSGTQNAIEILGFGAGVLSTTSNYLNPTRARTVLRNAARGHLCMAGQGDLVLSVWQTILGPQRTALQRELHDLNVALSRRLAEEGESTEGYSEAVATRDAAAQALALYDLQRRSLLNAHIEAEQVAWNFGIDLITRTDRSPEAVEQLVESITEQTESIARFAQAEEDAEPAPNGGDGAAGVGPQGLVGSRSLIGAETDPVALADRELPVLRRLTAAATARLQAGLPNAESLVQGLRTCASKALTGARPTVTPIQRINAR